MSQISTKFERDFRVREKNTLYTKNSQWIANRFCRDALKAWTSFKKNLRNRCEKY